MPISSADFMYPEEITLKMPDRLRGLLQRMSADGTEIPNPVADFTEKWKNVYFSTPLYSRFVYKMYNYLNNPELNLEYSRFTENSDAIIDMLDDVLREARAWLDSSDASLAEPKKAAPKVIKAADDEFRILLFITQFLSL